MWAKQDKPNWNLFKLFDQTKPNKPSLNQLKPKTTRATLNRVSQTTEKQTKQSRN